MINFHKKIKDTPQYSRQFTCGDTLITMFNCPASARLMSSRLTPVWSDCNYIVYVTEGRKIWHTGHGSFELKEGSCVFVRKGACILEQFFDTGFCVVMFFIPDEFLCETLQYRTQRSGGRREDVEPIIELESNERLGAFFLSMSSLFAENNDPDHSLLELKFRELILTIADNPRNEKLLRYFCMLMNEPRSVSLQRIMEENFRFNLKLEEYAALSNRSLSTFKRDFIRSYRVSPGRWLIERRLRLAKHLLSTHGKTVSEASFESGFENISHFSRSFRQFFGYPPSAIRHKRVILQDETALRG